MVCDEEVGEFRRLIVASLLLDIVRNGRVFDELRIIDEINFYIQLSVRFYN